MAAEGEWEVKGGALLAGTCRWEQSHGPLFLQLPTQVFILPADGV